MNNLNRRLCDLPRPRIICGQDTPPPRPLHPLLARFFEIARRQGKGFHAIAEKAGMARELLYYWKGRGKSPSLLKFNDALNVLGYELKIVKKRKR